MGVNILDAFLITFGLDAQEFQKGERDVRDGSKRLREDTKKTFDGMEEKGKQLGSTLKNVRNEVVGLGLAFMGARSISDMLKSMVTGAASADRFGQSIGMSVKQIYAWRKAMLSVGGTEGDADAALQTVQNLRMAYIQGSLGNDLQFDLARLGVSASDLENGNAGMLLSKIAGSDLRTGNPELFTSLLQQIGLNGPVLYFLQKGQTSVDKLIAAYEKDAKGQEELAKQSEQLQREMADLKTKIEKGLTPEIVKVVHALNQVVDLMTKYVDRDPLNPTHDPKGYKNAWDFIGGWIGGDEGKWITEHMGAQGSRATKQRAKTAKGSSAAASDTATSVAVSQYRGGKLRRAERNNNPGNIEDGKFARSQPGYVGSDGRFARFDTAQHGFMAMVRLLLGKSYRGSGIDTIDEILSKYAPASDGNNLAAYSAMVKQATGLSARKILTEAQTVQVAAAMAKHEGYRGNISIQNMTVNTNDAKSFPRDLRAKTSSAAAQADRGVAP